MVIITPTNIAVTVAAANTMDSIPLTRDARGVTKIKDYAAFAEYTLKI